MKLNPPNYRARQRRIEKFRTASRLRKPQSSKKIKKIKKKPAARIQAPKEISLHSRSLHHELTKFLRSLRKLSLNSKSIIIDFSATEKVHSSGMLLMLAEIDRIYRTLKHKHHITCTYPADDVVEKVFQQVGLFNLLGKAYRLTITENDRNVYHWKYATGICVNPQEADQMLKGVRDQVPKGYLRIVTGVEEAMDNAVHHAYLESRGDRLSGMAAADERRWWVFAEVLDGWLHVNFCDLGLGIPATLPTKWNEQVKDILSLTSLSEGAKDVRMIRRSLELGRTRTDQEHRGKGLKNIVKAAQELGGRLNVYSNMGVIGIDYGSGAPRYVQAAFKRSILGTVIQWSIPITDTQDLEDEHG